MKISRYINSLLALSSLFLMVGPARAADHWHTSTIKLIYPLADGSFAIMFNSHSAQCASSLPKYHYVTVGQAGITQEGSSKLYATVLMAKATDKPISIVFSDSTNYCYVKGLTLE
jgi:hypothetical protein